MKIQQLVENFEKEFKEKNSKDVAEQYKEFLNENIEELSQNNAFFSLPLNLIFSIISKISFVNIENKDKKVETLRNIIKNTILFHYQEKESLLILQNFNTETISNLLYEEIFSLLELITNCPILTKFCNFITEDYILPEKDFIYEIEQKDQKINELMNVVAFFSNDQNKISKAFQQNLPLIHIAAQNGVLPIMKYLIEQKNVDKDFKGKNEKTPLHYACKKGHISIVKYLLSKDANIEARDSFGNTPFIYARLNNHKDIIEYLQSKYFPNDFESNIITACEEGKLNSVKWLIGIENGDIEKKESNGKTLLHLACENGHLPIVEYLISKGADVNAIDLNGNTPFFYAHNNNHQDVALYVIDKKLDLEVLILPGLNL